jgi:outer membrane protein assembly factor BamB
MFMEFIGIMNRHPLKGNKVNSRSRKGPLVAGLFLLLGLIGAASVSGQIDSQWRGPFRTGAYPGERLLDSWPEEGPRLLWSAEGLGEGFSSAAVTENRIYVTGLIQSEGFLFAFDKEGKLLWKSSYGKEWSGSHPGARTTPTVVADRIYVMSAFGLVSCFDTAGKAVWTRDLAGDFGARNLEWGMTESLLVDGDRVFCTPGGREAMIAALDRHSGKILWSVKGNGQTSGYCSPCLVDHGKRRLLITMMAESVVGVDAQTGEFLWSAGHITDYNVHANTPIYDKGLLFIFSGYGTGGQMFKISPDGASIEKVWAQGAMDSQMGAAMLVDGFLYGSGHNRRGWHCLEWETGKVRYSQRKIGNKGNIIFAGGKLYCYSERGDVALVEPNPEDFEVISSFRIREGSGPHWAHLVIRDGRLYVRHGEILKVYDISG